MKIRKRRIPARRKSKEPKKTGRYRQGCLLRPS